MTIIKLPRPPAPLGRGDTLAGRYELLERLDEDASVRRSTAWRAHDARADAEVTIDLIASPAPQLDLAPLLTELGLDMSCILGAGKTQVAGVRYFYLASRPSISVPVLSASDVA